MTSSGAEGGGAAPEKAANGSSRPGERLKELVIPLFGADRYVGTFPTRLHTDLRHLVEMLRRGKQPRLATQRLAVLEEALAASSPDAQTPRTMAELRAQVEAWRAEGRAAFDAEKYYDKGRTAGYTEHNRGPQEDLSRRALQLCSLATGEIVPTSERGKAILAIDLGCGSGLSTIAAAKLPGYAMGVVGVDLSSEMLRSEAWEELTAMRCPLAAERVRCDLAQPLPFRRGTFDLSYSVAAVHYLAQDSSRRSAAERLDSFMVSLRRSLAERCRPVTLQAFLTREPTAMQKISEASERAGWALCDLVVDRAHGGSGADRDFLYLVAHEPSAAGPARPARCAMHRASQGTCAMALEDWARRRGVPAPLVEGSHRDWLEREHMRFAKRLVRLRERCGAVGADGQPLALDHAAPPDAPETAMAGRLAELLRDAGSAEGVEEAARLSDRVIAALHGEPDARAGS